MIKSLFIIATNLSIAALFHLAHALLKLATKLIEKLPKKEQKLLKAYDPLQAEHEENLNRAFLDEPVHNIHETGITAHCSNCNWSGDLLYTLQLENKIICCSCHQETITKLSETDTYPI